MTTTACSLLMLTALLFFSGSTVLAAPSTTAASKTVAASTSPHTWQKVCGSAALGYASCLSFIGAQQSTLKPQAVVPLATAPGGSAPYDPAELHTAYNLPTTASGTPTVAIVDAYNDPNAASNLATYRSEWGLSACTTASGCLKIVNQTGGTRLPVGNASWGEEISLDLDMVSAICQNCDILLVEATSASFADLGTAVKEAHTLGAIAISNSYGATESSVGSSAESSYCSSYYQYTYTAVVASTGDGGPIVEVPSSCPYTTGAGGTSLSSTGTETAWNTSSSEGAGGGCSAYTAIPSWQSSSVTGCSRRATGDVSADADPATGVYVYDSYGVRAGWYEFGGTSVASPIIASVFALAGNVSTTQYPASLPWANYTSGCVFKVASKTYAYQTGLGSPDGTSCF